MKCPGSGQLLAALSVSAAGWEHCPACGQRVPVITPADLLPRLMPHNTNRRPSPPIADAPTLSL